VELIFKVRVVVKRKVPGYSLLFLLFDCHLQEGGSTAHFPFQQAPFHVVFYGFEEEVMLIHVPLLVGALLELVGALLETNDVVVGLHLSRGLALQWHIPQQAGNHNGFIHIVGRSYKAVHHVEERVLIAGWVDVDLHHGEGCVGLVVAAGCCSKAELLDVDISL